MTFDVRILKNVGQIDRNVSRNWAEDEMVRWWGWEGQVLGMRGFEFGDERVRVWG